MKREQAGGKDLAARLLGLPDKVQLPAWGDLGWGHVGHGRLLHSTLTK